LLHTQLKPEREGEEDETRREKGREEELMESLAELQAKLTDTQERYHQAVEEVEELREHMGREGGETTDQQEVQRRTSSTLEQEVKQLRALLVQSGSELELAAQRSRQLEEERRSVKEGGERTVRIEELHKEAQEEIRILQVNMGLFSPLNISMTERGIPAVSHIKVRLQVSGCSTAKK